MSYGLGLKLKSVCESQGSKVTVSHFTDLIREKKIDPYKVRVAELTEAFLGRDVVRKQSLLNAIKLREVHALESTEAVDASTFSNITGQLLVTIVKEKYNSPEFIGDRLMKTVPNPGNNLKTHIVPLQSDVVDYSDKIDPLIPYPKTTFKESWYVMPSPEKRGSICAVSMEMLMSDLTGQTQQSAASVGYRARYNKEQRQLSVVLGLTNNYIWNGNAMNTYIPTTAGVGGYVNKLLSKTITNYNDINDVEMLFWRMTDPITGLRIMSRPTAVLVMPSKRYDMWRILNTTEVRVGETTASSTSVQGLSANPLDSNYPILTSPIAEQLLLDAGKSTSTTKDIVYFGDFQKAFFYREVYPVQVINAPALNPDEYNQDIVLSVRVSEYGVAGVADPRYAVEATAEAS